jgi:hypothetical protein
MPPEERHDKIGLVMQDIGGLLMKEAELGAAGLAAVQAGAVDQLADVSEELLICHASYAVKYRELMGLWLRPTRCPGSSPPPA